MGETINQEAKEMEVAAESSYQWSAFRPEGAPVGFLHRDSAYLGDHAGTGETSQTVAVMARKEVNRYECT